MDNKHKHDISLTTKETVRHEGFFKGGGFFLSLGLDLFDFDYGVKVGWMDGWMGLQV